MALRVRWREIDPDWLRQKYVVERLTRQQIADRCGETVAVVTYALRQHGLRPAWRYQRLDPDWLRQKYVDERLSQAQIGELCGVSPSLIGTRMRRYGIPARPAGGWKQAGEASWHSADWLHQKYWVEGLSQQAIAEMCGCHQQTIIKALRRHGLLRSQMRDLLMAMTRAAGAEPAPTIPMARRTPRPDGTLYLFRRRGRTVFMRLSLDGQGRPGCSLGYDDVIEIPVRDRARASERLAETPAPVAAWLADLV